MKYGTGKYYGQQPDRRRYRAIILYNGRVVVAHGVYSGMLQAEREVSKWVWMINHIYPAAGARIKQIKRLRHGTF